MSSTNVQIARRAALSLLTALALVAVAYGRQDTSRVQAPDGMTIFTGRYSNHRFGFSFLIPRGLRGTGPPDGYPQSGVVISLPGGEGMAEIRVYGHYDAAFAGSARAQAEVELGYAREDSPALRLLRRRDTRLGRLRAVRFTYEYEQRPSAETLICDHVIAYRPSGYYGDRFFHVKLTTTRRRYAEDGKTFEKVLRSWRMAPVL